MTWVRVGALFMAVGVLLGAFGAHGLKAFLEPDQMDVFKTGVFYQIVNALGLLVIGVLGLQNPRARTFPSGAFLSAGILLFSGSLYLITLKGMSWMGAVTPIGGICLVAGWIFLVFTL